MKKRKKIIVLEMALLSFSLSACGSGSGKDSAGSPSREVLQKGEGEEKQEGKEEAASEYEVRDGEVILAKSAGGNPIVGNSTDGSIFMAAIRRFWWTATQCICTPGMTLPAILR